MEDPRGLGCERDARALPRVHPTVARRVQLREAILRDAEEGDGCTPDRVSGKPAVVQHTGKSRVLPDAEGLFRFRNMDEAVRALSTVESDYGRHARLARELAAQFDARDVVARVLERALAATGSDRERAATAGARV